MVTDQYNTCYSDDKKSLIKANDCNAESYCVAEGTQTILAGAFAFNNMIREIILPESIKTIEDNAFGSCDNLEHIDMSRCKIKVIPKNCFYWSKALKRLELPDTVIELKDNAFACAGLDEVDFRTLFGNVKKWGNGLFESSEIRKVTGVSVLTKEMFRNCANLIEIELEEGITEIPDYAFHGCENLERIVVPDTVKTFGFWSLTECPLKEITLPANLQKFPDVSVEWSSMQKVSSHSKDYVVEQDAVWNADKTIIYKFWGVNLPVTDFPIDFRLYAVATNQKIEKIAISEGTTLRSYCFQRCSNLKEANISTRSIPIGGFEDCGNLRVVQLNGCKSISKEAFLNCENLASINLEDVVMLDNRCFANCKSLKEIRFGQDIEKIEDCFYGCDSLETICFSAIPHGELTITKLCFESAPVLKEILIPNGSLKVFKKLIPRNAHSLLKESVNNRA